MKLPENKKLFTVVVAFVIVSVALTFVIIFNAVSGVKAEPTIIEEVEIEKTYENAYITSCENGKISFIFEGDMYQVSGATKEACIGVADLVVSDGKLRTIRLKEDTISGLVEAYTKTSLNIENYGEIQCISKLPIYDISGDVVEQRSTDTLIVGTSDLKFVLEDNVVCAAVKEKNYEIHNIRVLIKNGNSIHFDNLCLENETGLSCGDKQLGTSFNANAYFEGIKDKEAVILASDGRTRIGTSTDSLRENGYSGGMIVIKEDDGYVLVNELPIEEYLRFVLPSEMPLNFEFEALKAQAICARTFVYSQISNDKYAKYGANLDDSTTYQVYNKSGTYDVTDKAVQETVGEVVCHNGEYITCYYFSTCGDKTKTLEVWDTEAEEGYIKSVKSEDESSPFYRWKAKIRLGKLYDDELGRLKSVEKNDKLIAHYQNGDMELTKENEIRKYLGGGLIQVELNDGTIREDLSLIPSAYFEVLDIDDGIMYIRGEGFGHGIGLSQYGANEMALEGKDYRAIIQYYYNDVSVLNMED